jgi:hypothetical protein
MMFFIVDLSAQDKSTSSEKFSIGLGIDIESFYNYEYLGPIASLNLTFDLFESLRLEPEIGFQKSDRYNENDKLESNSKRITAGLGGYWLFHLNNVTPFVGLRYSRSNYEYMRDNFDGTFNEHYTKETIFGPVLGIEYRFTKHFSIGADFGYHYIKSNHQYVYRNSDDNSLVKGNGTTSSIRFRFFFL